MTLLHEEPLYLLLLVPILAIAFALDGQRRRRALERVGHLAQVRRMTASVSVGRRRLKAVLLVAGVALIALSLARPQRQGVAHMLPRRGLDLVVALDFSRSMLAADVYPSRLERAKFELSRLVDGLKGDRVGLVAFAGVTLSYPLTSDYAAAKLFFRDLGPEDIPVGGTNLGEAMRAGLELLRGGQRDMPGDARKPAQVLLLLTDGADTEGGAADAAREAQRRGVKIFSVGIGSREGEVVVLSKKADGTAEYVTDPLGTPVRMALDEEALRQMAKETGGEYFQLDPERFGLEGVQKALSGLERVEEEKRVVHEPEEAYGLFLAPALALLAIEALTRDRRRRAKAARAATGDAASTTTSGETAEAARAGARRRLGARRRAGGDAATAALLLALALPLLSAWSPVLRLSPDVQQGIDALAANKPDEALAAFDRELAARPDDLLIHYDRGAALYALGKLPEAEREFLRATESQDAALRADAFYNMGNAILRSNRPKEAIDAYKRALKLRPDDRRAKWNLEIALRMLDKQQDENKQQQGDDKQKQDQNNKDQKDQGKDQDKNQHQGGNDSKQDENKKDQDKNKPDQKDPKDQKDDQDQKDPAKPPEDKQQDENKKKQDENKTQQDENKKKQDENKPDQKDQKDRQDQPEPQGQGEPDKGDKPPQKGNAGANPPGNPIGNPIEKQDAEAVLDAFERVEPTVQKDLAKRRAKDKRPRKDW